MIGREERGREAITYTRKTIRDGGIVAIKGIGGFHLCCDASNEEAVSRLRTLKRRPTKPFAIMAKDMDAVYRECEVSPLQEEILTGHQKPILLLKKRSEKFFENCNTGEAIASKQEDSDKKNLLNIENVIAATGEELQESHHHNKDSYSHLAPSVAPGNPKVGVMLPYAPVQLLIFQYDDGVEMPDLLVMTSGNTSGAPICRDDTEAVEELSHLCDCILSHDRKIRIRADDSVMDFYKGEPYMIRRSRGYAPLPFMTSADWKGQVMAVGGELKNTFCIGVDSRFYPSPYVGDLEDLRTVKALEETMHRFETLLEVEPQLVVCDMHPKYNSTVVAEDLGLPILRVQHHYAHILSCMTENDCQEPVIGVSFDGTGYGMDGTIWGGEILLADMEGFQRLGSITPFLQVGGDASAKEGWRIAASLIYQMTGSKEEAGEIIEKLDLCSPQEYKVLFTMADRKINAVTSTSAGRLFDGVSAILGIRKKSTFEGEASTALQFAAEHYAEECGKQYEKLVGNVDKILFHTQAASDTENGTVISDNNTMDNMEPIHCTDKKQIRLNTIDLVKRLAEERLKGTDTELLAWCFHKALAEQIAAACRLAAESAGCRKVALSGGVFQNCLLLRLTEELLQREDFEVLRHHMIPPNEGGIAIGQAAYGMWRLNHPQR